jgi:hypothetical protein
VIYEHKTSHTNIINDDKVVSDMNKNSEYCQLKRMSAGWSANAIAIFVLAVGFTGCTTVQTNDSQISDEERHKKQAEIRASLVTDDENSEQENTKVEKSPTMGNTTTQAITYASTEIDEASQQDFSDSKDFSRYVTNATNWLGDVFSWSDSSTAAIEPENVVTLKSEPIVSTTILNSAAKLESDDQNTNTPIDASQKAEVKISPEIVVYNQALDNSPLIESKALSIVENLSAEEESVLVTNSLLLDKANDNESLITAINTLTTENPSAAGISTEVLEQEVRARINVESTITQPTSQPLLKPIVVNSKLLKAWQECALSTPTIELESPGYTTQMWLNVFDDRLMVNATTNIDINMKKVGIKVDNGKLQKFSGKLYASNVVWSADMQSLFKNHNSLKIFIGGDELGRNRQTTEISMADLKALYLANTNCSN